MPLLLATAYVMINWIKLLRMRYIGMDWLTGTTIGKFIWAFLISMLPVVELRGGLPVAITSGLPIGLALTATILGNMLPVPFIIIFIKKVFAWMRRNMPRMDSFVSKMEKRAEGKRGTIERYGPWGLLLFVAIPAPGTGAWTGTLAASILDMDFKNTILAVICGIALAGVIVGVLCTLGFGAWFGIAG